MKIKAGLNNIKKSMAGIGKDNGSEKNWVDKVLGDVSKESAAKQLAMGTASGWVAGYLSMKVGKMAAVAVGSSIIVLQIAQHKGYIKINWDKVEKQADKVLDKMDINPSSSMDKLERFVDRKVDKTADFLNSKQKKARGWLDSFINNGDQSGYQLQELHIFVLAFGVGVSLGLISG